MDSSTSSGGGETEQPPKGGESFGGYAAMFNEVREATGKPAYEPGEAVRVERSAGGIEDDWHLAALVRNQQGEEVVLVTKTSQEGKKLHKRVPVRDFLTLNPRS
jgi:hypothetical protein